jgi:hypothetical protein
MAKGLGAKRASGGAKRASGGAIEVREIGGS